MTHELLRGLRLLFFCGILVTAGCSSDGRGTGNGFLRAGLPPGAVEVKAGTDAIIYSPDERGRVFIYDVARDRVTGRYHMRPGQRLAVDATSGRATIDGNEVQVGELSGGSTYRVYFLRAGD